MNWIERVLERSAITRKALEASYRKQGAYPVTLANQQFLCDPYHRDFWRNAARGSWEPETLRILARLLDNKSVYMDIGAWIGPTVIYAARFSNRVVCFEPDYVAYRYLLWNIELNRLTNVQPFNFALSDRSGMQTLASRFTGLGDSTSSLLTIGASREQIQVSCLSWSEWLNLSGFDRAHFIKMDIEGGEFCLLPTMRDFLRTTKPIVYLSLHPHLLPAVQRREAVQRLVDGLSFYGKCLNEHLEPVAPKSLSEGMYLEESKSVLFMP